MEFLILGPLEVVSDGQILDLGGAKQRALLAALLLDANNVVSTDRLIDALWEDDPPGNARKALQVQVSGLRKVVGKDRLQTRDAGYILVVGENEFDLAGFQRLRDQGRPGEALSLWRGPPLSDFSYRRFAQGEIARLEDVRLACLEDRIDQDLAAGLHAELTGELERLVREHPLRERLQGQLMLALYRSSRQAEALEAYQEARSMLVEELGIEPGRELRDLHQRILNQDPGLDREIEPDQEAAEVDEAGPPSRPQPRETRKRVTVLCASLTTTTAERRQLDPEALRRIGNRAFSEIQSAVERHGGSVEAVSSVALTAIFGVPVVHEDDALRALRSAVDAATAVSQVAAGVQVQQLSTELRIGVSSGEVLAGGALQPTGEPLTAALRLAEHAHPGRILLDGTTQQLVRNLAVTEARGDAFELLELRPLGPVPAPRSPMVGRVRERQRLRQAFEQALADCSCQLFTVVGTAGVGKSRLVQEFLDEIGPDALVARGRCLPYGEGITYWPLLEATKEAIGLRDDDSPDEANSRLVAALGDEPVSARLAQRVAGTIGLAEAPSGVEDVFPAIRALFEALARTGPLVLVFDDIHWGEATFLDLLEHLADRVRDVPLLLICLARPELVDVRPGWAGGKLNVTSILLEPLSETESAELVANLARAELDDLTAQRIVDASEGNPLFVEEMLALALDEGLPAGEIHVPPTIQSLLTARLDRLPATERAVIDCASVEGKVFSEKALIAVAPDDLSSEIPASLDSLLQRGLIRAEPPSLGGRGYRFRHILLRDSAYDSVPKEARAGMHERFARWLDRTAGGRATEYAEIIGYHLEQASRYRAELGELDETTGELAREAADRLGEAGRRAFLRSDAPAGVNLVSRAASLLEPDDPRRVDLIPNVRVVQGTGAEMGWADRVLTEAVEAAATTGDRRLAAQALVQRGLLRLFTEEDVTANELVDTAQRAIAVFADLQDDLGLARAWRLKAQAHYLGRCAGLSAEASEKAVSHARRAGERFERRESEEWLVIALIWGPMPSADAVRRCTRLLAECTDDPAGATVILGALSVLTTMSGQVDKANDFTAQARALLEDLGEGVWIVSFHLAEALLLQDDWAGAEAEARARYDELKRIGGRSHISALTQLLAEAVYRQGRLDEAEEFTRECEQTAQANDVHDQIRWRAVRAKVHARRAEAHEAETLSREAAELADVGDFLVARAATLMDLAEVLELSDRRDAAAATLQEAIRCFELKGNVIGAGKARMRLRTLQ